YNKKNQGKINLDFFSSHIIYYKWISILILLRRYSMHDNGPFVSLNHHDPLALLSFLVLIPLLHLHHERWIIYGRLRRLFYLSLVYPYLLLLASLFLYLQRM